MNKLLEKYRSLPVQVRASLWALICGVLQRGVAVIVTPIFTRLMSTAEYGDFTTFQSWLDILGIFLTLRLYYGVFLQGLVRYGGNEDRYTSALIGLMTSLEIAGLALYLPLRNILNGFTHLTTAQTLSIFVISWASGLFEFWCARQRVEYRYRALAALTLAFAILQPTCGVLAILAFPQDKVNARVLSMALVQLCAFGWLFVLYLKRGKTLFDAGHWRHALTFNLPLIPHYLSSSLLSTSDRIMIRSLVSASAAGIYGLSYSLSFLMTIVNQALLNTLNPWIYQQIKSKNYRQLAHVSYLALAGVAGANLFVVALAPEAISIFAPVEYHDGIWLVPPLAATVVVMFMYSLFADFEFYYERTDLVMWASVVGAVVNVGLNWLCIPVFGYQVAAWTTLVGYIFYIGMHYAFMRRVQRTEMDGVYVYDVKVLVLILGSFALAAMFLTVLYPVPVARYALCLIAVAIVFVRRDSLIALYKQLRQR